MSFISHYIVNNSITNSINDYKYMYYSIYPSLPIIIKSINLYNYNYSMSQGRWGFVNVIKMTFFDCKCCHFKKWQMHYLAILCMEIKGKRERDRQRQKRGREHVKDKRKRERRERERDEEREKERQR